MPKTIPNYLSRWTGRHTRIASTIPVSLFTLLKNCLPPGHGNTDSDVIRFACHNAGLLCEKQRELDAEKEQKLDEKALKKEDYEVEQLLNAEPVDCEPCQQETNLVDKKRQQRKAAAELQQAVQAEQRDRSGD